MPLKVSNLTSSAFDERRSLTKAAFNLVVIVASIDVFAVLWAWLVPAQQEENVADGCRQAL